MNKKGSEGTVMIASLFLLAILFYFAFFFFKIGIKTEESTINAVELGDSQIILLNILRSNVDGKDLSDLLVEGYVKGDYREFRKGFDKTMEKAYSGGYKGYIVVRVMPENKRILTTNSVLLGPADFERSGDIYGNDETTAKANVPIDNKKYLEVRLYD